MARSITNVPVSARRATSVPVTARSMTNVPVRSSYASTGFDRSSKSNIAYCPTPSSARCGTSAAGGAAPILNAAWCPTLHELPEGVSATIARGRSNSRRLIVYPTATHKSFVATASFVVQLSVNPSESNDAISAAASTVCVLLFILTTALAALL